MAKGSKQLKRIVDRKRRPKRDDPTQSRAFIKAAREAEADEEKSEAEAVLGVLSKKPPTPHTSGEKK